MTDRNVCPPDNAGWTPWRDRVFLTLTLGGSAIGIWSGQSNALVLALILFALAAIARGRWWVAAWLLAVPVFIKLWPLAIVVLLIIYWPRQLTLRFAAACLLLAVIPFLTRPPSVVVSQYRGWYDRLADSHQARHDGYRDAWTFWEQLGPTLGGHVDWQNPASTRVYTAMQLAAALAVLGWCLWRFPWRGIGGYPLDCSRGGADAASTVRHLLTGIFSIWAAWQLFFGPATEQLTYGLIAPAVAWAVMVSVAEKKARWLTLASWTLLALLPSGDVERAVLHIFPLGRVLLPIGILMFVVWLVWHERGATTAYALRPGRS